ncbi:MAG: NADH-quinone oxidoreductase subunit A [Planctomycetota bacterium]|nr:NADH-quinone oxidoreductase subunit A [Planctomycetota bacterium]
MGGALDFTPEVFGAVLYIVLAVAMAVAVLGLVQIATRCFGKRLGIDATKRGKYEPYECGVPLLGSARERYAIRFYLVALFFVLFDIEVVFLLPYAVAYKTLGREGFFEVLAFVAVLAVGLLYILKRRALEWD